MATGWISDWVVAGTELIMWILSWFLADFRDSYVTFLQVWLWVGIVLYFIPVLFWILAAVVDKVAFTGDLNTQFIVAVIILAAHIIVHVYFVPVIATKPQGGPSCECKVCEKGTKADPNDDDWAF